MLSSNPDLLRTFSLVIASNLVPSVEAQLADTLWQGKYISNNTHCIHSLTCQHPLQSVVQTFHWSWSVARALSVGSKSRYESIAVRLQFQVLLFLAEDSVVDTHPDNTHTLRVDRPFPALEAYAKGLDLESMDSMEHSHVPWIVLLVKAALVWKETVGRSIPSDGRVLINSARRSDTEGSV